MIWRRLRANGKDVRLWGWSKIKVQLDNKSLLLEIKGKRTHGHGQQCGDCWEEAGIRGLIGNRKNTIKVKFLKRNE